MFGAIGRTLLFAAFVFSFSFQCIALPRTFEYCENGFPVVKCNGSEQCSQLLNNGDAARCSTRTEPCFCIDRYRYGKCDSSKDCSRGEACVKLLSKALARFCVSCEAIFRRSPLPVFVDSEHKCFTPSPLPTPIPVPFIKKDDTFKTCYSREECNNVCVYIKEYGYLGRCSGSGPCFCFGDGYYFCDDSLDCAVGEVCAVIQKGAPWGHCIPCEAVERRSPRPSLADSQHYCGKNVPVLPRPDDTFKYCNNGVLYTSCKSMCSSVLNDGSVGYCRTHQPCFCFDQERTCTESSDCHKDEACVKLVPLTSKSYCASCEAIYRRSPRPLFIDKKHSCSATSPSITPYPLPAIYDDIFKPCSTRTDCPYDFECIQAKIDSDVSEDCKGSKNCFCFYVSPLQCSGSKDCAIGDGCLVLNRVPFIAYCVSCDRSKLHYKIPDFYDSNHYCNGEIPILPASTDIFRHCYTGVPYQCHHTERCIEFMNGGTVDDCSQSFGPCFCFPKERNIRKCTSSGKCMKGEACVKLAPWPPYSFCAPCEAVYRSSLKLKIVARTYSCPSPPPLATPYPTPANVIDETLKPCKSYKDCIQECHDDVLGEPVDCFIKANCFCADYFPCKSSRECGIGQACVYPTSKWIKAFCVTCKRISEAFAEPRFVDKLHIC